jgi:hypothetical protein
VSFRKKEQLYGLVSGALELPDAYADSGSGLSAPVKTALMYIQNCRQDIRVSAPPGGECVCFSLLTIPS